VRRVRRIFLVALALAFLWMALITWLDPSYLSEGTIENLISIVIFGILFLSVWMVLLLPILLWAGGKASLQHLVLRCLLVRNRTAPWRYVQFLDEAADRLLLRKVGGGYVFVHRLLLDHFADLPQGEAAEMASRTAADRPA
jgi:hypothetical protein